MAEVARDWPELREETIVEVAPPDFVRLAVPKGVLCSTIFEVAGAGLCLFQLPRDPSGEISVPFPDMVGRDAGRAGRVRSREKRLWFVLVFALFVGRPHRHPIAQSPRDNLGKGNWYFLYQSITSTWYVSETTMTFVYPPNALLGERMRCKSQFPVIKGVCLI